MPRPRKTAQKKVATHVATRSRDRPAAAPESKRRTNEVQPAPAPVSRGLSSSQKRYLRGFTHDLKALVLVGHKGVTPALLAEFDNALEHHELVKVKLADDDRDARADSIERIRAHSGADVVQTIGKVACFYLRNAERAQFTLPR